ncbi:unnamed protein product, partial [Amoebophrya sp. A120]|eukprot:GSA120T00019927001.1
MMDRVRFRRLLLQLRTLLQHPLLFLLASSTSHEIVRATEIENLSAPPPEHGPQQVLRLDLGCEEKDLLPREEAKSVIQYLPQCGRDEKADGSGRKKFFTESGDSCCNLEAVRVMKSMTESVLDLKRRLIPDTETFLKDAEVLLDSTEEQIHAYFGKFEESDEEIGVYQQEKLCQLKRVSIASARRDAAREAAKVLEAALNAVERFAESV